MTRARQRGALTQERRDELLRVAYDVFVERGYSGTTMLEIARRGRASKGTLYTLFSNKETLFETLLLTRMREIPAGLNPDLAVEEPDQYDYLCLSAYRILEVASRSSTVAMFRIALAEVPRFPELRQILKAARNHEGLTVYLAKCRDRGLMAFDDPEAAASMFVAMATGEWVNQMLNGEIDEVPYDRLIAHASLTARMFLTAVAPSGDCVAPEK
jgi:AcrR family transcriptional regulator